MFRFVALCAILFAAITKAQDAATTTATTTADADVAVSSALNGGNAACGEERIRLPWDMMSPEDQALYREAIEVAIERKIFQHFVKVHMDTMSEMEAHDTCGFVLWHRRFGLAYEIMLRSLDERFKCVTLPYINTMEHFKNQVDGKCRNLGECSAIIFGLGGTPQSKQTRTFNGKAAENYCYSASPYEAYCDDSDKCGCMPRNNVSAVTVPSGSSYVSLFNMISSSKKYSDFTTALQNGVHNEFHGVVGGTMGTFASPADPLFFSWHATVDMLHYVWHECHLADPLTDTEKRASAYAFNQEDECRLTADAIGNIKQMSAATEMYMQIDGKSITEHPTIGVYFEAVGSAYGDYSDSRAMGDFSYTYRVPAGFVRVLNDESMCPAAADREPFSETDAADEEAGSVNGSLSYWQWYDQTKEMMMVKYDNDTDRVNQQMEYLECVGVDEKFGVQEFDDSFMEDFLAGKDVSPRCETLIKEIEAQPDLVDASEVESWGENADVTEEAKVPSQLADSSGGRLGASILLLFPTLAFLTWTL